MKVVHSSVESRGRDTTANLETGSARDTVSSVARISGSRSLQPVQRPIGSEGLFVPATKRARVERESLLSNTSLVNYSDSDDDDEEEDHIVRGPMLPQTQVQPGPDHTAGTARRASKAPAKRYASVVDLGGSSEEEDADEFHDASYYE